MNARRALFALACILVAGCGMPPRPDVEAALVGAPATWQADRTASPDGAVVADWWRHLGSDALTAAIQRALEHNQDVRAAEARLAAAAAQARLAGAALTPSLDVGASATRQRSVFVGLPFGGAGPFTNTFNNYGVSLNASWELDLWGRIRSGRAAAVADVRASAEDLRGLRQSLAAQTAKAWFAAVEARQQVALARDTVASYRATEQQIEDRFRGGVRGALDLRFARSRTRAAEAQQHLWRERFERAVRQLEVLQGAYPEGRADPGSDLPAPDAPVAAGVPAELLRRRPDLASAEARMRAAGFRVDAAHAALFPGLSLGGRAGTTSDRTSDLLDLDFLVWNIAANLVAPVLDGGRRRAELDLAAAREHEAVAGYAQRALDAFREVETLLAAERHLRRQADSLDAARVESDAARALAEDRYGRGLGEYIPVLEAQRGALAAAGQVLSARRQLLDLRVDLHLALGGGLPTPVDPAPAKETDDR